MQSTTTMQSTSANKYIKTSQWDTQGLRYMQPRTTERGLKTVAVISTQKNKKLHIQMPSITCWGIKDYIDQSTGESDGKFTITLHFSGKENYITEDSKVALEKLKAFEEQILNDAVNNSEAWFGKHKSRELVEDAYYPFLKMGKNSETKKPDPEKGIYFRPKVNCYSGSWDVEIYDPEGSMLFPSENEGETPIDFVPSGSQVTCGIECKQIWIGAKGWGISWALKQCVVIPKQVENTSRTLQLDLSYQDIKKMYEAPTQPNPEEDANKQAPVKKEEDVYAEDSDNEVQEEESVPEQVVEPEAEQVVEPEPVPVVEPPKKKTVVKKAAEPSTATAEAPVKKKVARKKA